MSATSHNASVLVIDDDASTRRTLALILTQKGYRVETAETGQDALVLAGQQPFDAALLDIRLADSEGVELLGPLRQAQSDIVLIIATGYASVETAVRAVNEGADGYVTKPLDMDALLVKLADLLERQRLRRENRQLYAQAQQELEDRRRAEQALRERERELSTLLGNLPGMAYRCQNVPTWTMEFVSEGCRDLTGYEPQDLLHDHTVAYSDLIAPEDRALVQNKVRAALEQNKPFELTYRLVAASGAVRWVWERGRGIRDDDGNVRFLEGFVHDVTERRRAETISQKLYETSRALARSLDETSAIHTILKAVYETLGCEYALLSAVDAQARTIQVRHGIWQGRLDALPGWIETTPHALDEPGLLTGIVRRGKIEIVDEWDERFDPAAWDQFDQDRLLRIFMPIRMQKRVLGVIEVAFDRTTRPQIDQAEIETLTAFADQAAAALENARLFAETERRAVRLHALYEIDQAVLTAQSTHEIAQAALAHIRQLVPVTAALVVLLDLEAAQSVTLAIDQDRPIGIEVGVRVPIKIGPELDALAQDQIVIDSSLSSSPDLPPALAIMRDAGIEIHIAVPLRVEGLLIGLLSLVSEQPIAFTAEHAAILRQVSNQVAVALHNARLADARRVESERLRTLIDNLPEGVLLLTPDERIVLANPVGEQMLAWLGAAPNQPLAQIGPHTLGDLLNAGPSALLTLVIQEPPKSVQAAAVAIVSPEMEQRGMLVLLRDVTELRQAQELARQRDRLAAVGRLAGGVAHDFNNILTAITGYTDLVRDALHSDNPLDWPPGVELRADLEQVVLFAGRAAALTRQLLIFSRKESVQQPQVFDLNALLSGMSKMLVPLLGEDIQLTLSTSQAPEPIEADPGQIEQVVMNLAVNARDAMPRGGLLSIETEHVTWDTPRRLSHAQVGAGDYVRLTVRDAGIGMSEQILSHLFEPFFTTKAPGKGTGLGLSTVYGIVQQAGGHIDVHSEPGRGTTFDIYLPRVPKPASLRADARRKQALTGSADIPAPTETILLVEDEDGVRELARRILERRGYTVLAARNPGEALALSARYQARIDLLLTDVVMPEMNGQSLAEQIVANRPEIKVLFMSGYPGSAVGQWDLQPGDERAAPALNLLQKPFDTSELVRRVRQTLGEPTAAPHPPETIARQPGTLRTLHDLRSGEQVCLICQDEAECRAAIVPLVQQGLEQRHKIRYLTDALAAQAILKELQAEGLDIESIQAAGQFVAGDIDLSEVDQLEEIDQPTTTPSETLIAWLHAQTAQAAAEGYAALRILIDMARMQRLLGDQTGLNEFASRLNELLPGSTLLIVCQYNRQQFDARALLNALRIHPLVLIDAQVYDNFYYTGAAQLSGEQAENTLKHWLDSLELRRKAEAAIRESEAKLRSFIEQSDDAIVLTDEQARVVEWNRGAVCVYGIDRDQAVGRPLWDVQYQVSPAERKTPQARQAWEKAIRETLKAGWGPQLNALRETEILWPDGARRTLQTLAFAIQTSEGFILASISRDVTEQKRAQESLIKSEARYRSLIEHIPALIYETPFGEANPSFYAGPQIERLLGFSQQEWTESNRLWLEQIHPDDRVRVLTALAKSHESGQPFSAEYRLVARDGRPVWFYDEAVVVRDEAGNPLFLHGIMLEINARKQAEEDLRHYAIRLALLNELGQQIAAELDLERVLSQAVYLVREGFGYHHVGLFTLDRERSELVMRAVAGAYVDLFPSGHRVQVGRGMIGWVARHGERLLANDVRREPQYMNFYPDRVTTQSELSVPVRTGGQVVGVLDVQSPDLDAFGHEDILVLETLADQIAVAIKNARLYAALSQERVSLARRVQERTAELSLANAELARAARLKDEFLASMSHELRTPLNAILGLSEAVLEEAYGPLTERQSKSLRSIGEAGAHLLTLVNDILDVAKAEAGKLELQIEPLPVRELCQASLGLVRQMAHQKRIQVSLEVDEQVGIIEGDLRRLKQVLVNLLSNAVKFTPEEGQIGLEVKGDPVREVVHLAVWDKGIGIADEDLGRLFQPFVQLDGSLSRQYAGTGLGLALTRRLIELHGGGIAVQSQVGQGSRFTVSLPWAARAAAPQAEPSPAERIETAIEAGVQAGETARLVLLAEDNPVSVTMFQDYLLAKGYRVIVATNGFEALELARTQHPDLILMDIQMPEMDGLTAIRRLRAGQSRLPIVALTALAMPGDRERCLQAGADEYLSKPVSMGQLLAVIETLIQERRASGDNAKHDLDCR